MNYGKLLIQGIVSFVAIIGIAYGRLVSFPDAVSRLYGLPLIWGVHQLVSIAGPIDFWSVNVTYLVFDLMFWMLVLLVISILMDRKRARADKASKLLPA